MHHDTAPGITDDDEKILMRNRIRDLELVLGQHDSGLITTFKLTPVLSNFLGLLLSVPVVTPEIVRQRLEIAPDAKVAKHRLKKAMQQYDIKIHSRRNVGYWLEDADKARIRGLVAAKQREGREAGLPGSAVEEIELDELDDLPEAET